MPISHRTAYAKKRLVAAEGLLTDICNDVEEARDYAEFVRNELKDVLSAYSTEKDHDHMVSGIQWCVDEIGRKQKTWKGGK